MIDMTDETQRETGFKQLIDTLSNIAASHPVWYRQDPELDALRAKFDRVFGRPIVRSGTNALDCEERMLWIAMKEAGYGREIECCYSGGWVIQYGNGASYRKPFWDETESIIVEYRAAISCLEVQQS